LREIHVPSVNAATGRPFVPVQTNVSISRRGALRGIAYTQGSPGQAKLVSCLAGAVLDVMVDLRRGSPAFGRWHVSHLTGDNGRSVLVPEGVGHCFLALTEGAVVLYLLSTAHAPERERSVNALDAELALPWPNDLFLIRSDRDLTAPTVQEAAEAGLLPRFEPR
jgi:dTDP-4-dehydrorhamnose 3,5-epimerase